jgi:hypothetical protein
LYSLWNQMVIPYLFGVFNFSIGKVFLHYLDIGAPTMKARTSTSVPSHHTALAVPAPHLIPVVRHQLRLAQAIVLAFYVLSAHLVCTIISAVFFSALIIINIYFIFYSFIYRFIYVFIIHFDIYLLFQAIRCEVQLARCAQLQTGSFQSERFGMMLVAL